MSKVLVFSCLLILLVVGYVQSYQIVTSVLIKDTYSAGALPGGGCKPKFLITLESAIDESISIASNGIGSVIVDGFRNNTVKMFYMQVSGGIFEGSNVISVIVNSDPAQTISMYNCEAPPALQIPTLTSTQVIRYEDSQSIGSNTLYIPISGLSKDMIVSTSYSKGYFTFDAIVEQSLMTLTYKIQPNPTLTSDGHCEFYIGNGYFIITMLVNTFLGNQNGTITSRKNYVYSDATDTLTNSFIGTNLDWFNTLKISVGSDNIYTTYKPVQGLPASTLYVSQYPTQINYLSGSVFTFTQQFYNSSITNDWNFGYTGKVFAPETLNSPTMGSDFVSSSSDITVVYGYLTSKNYIQGTKAIFGTTFFKRDFPLYPYGIQNGNCNNYTLYIAFLVPYYSSTTTPISRLTIEQYTINYSYVWSELDQVVPQLSTMELTYMDYPQLNLRISAFDSLSGISKIVINDITLTAKDLVENTIFNGFYETSIYPHQINYGYDYSVTVYDNAYNSQLYQYKFDKSGLYDPRFPSTMVISKLDSPYNITELFWDSSINLPGMNRTLYIRIDTPDPKLFRPKLTVNIPNYQVTSDNFYMTLNTSTGYFHGTVYLPNGLYSQTIDYELQVYPYTFGVSSLYSMFGESALLSVNNSNPLGADQFPPIIVSYKPPTSPITLTSGLSTVSVEITIQDGINGFESGNITFSSDLDPQGFSFNFNSSTMVSQGIYKFDLTFNIVGLYCVQQNFDIKSIYLSDKMGYISQHPAPGKNYLNPWFAMNSQSITSIFSVKCPISSIPDPTPPVLDSFIVEPISTVNLCGNQSERTFTIKLAIRDPESGVLVKNAPYVYFEGLNDLIGFQSAFVSGQSGASTPKTYQLTATLPYSFGIFSKSNPSINNNGVLLLSVYGIFDNAMNVNGYSFNDLMNNGFNYYINTTCTFQPVIESTSSITENGGFFYLFGQRLKSSQKIAASISYDAVNFQTITVSYASGVMIKLAFVKPTRLPFIVRVNFGDYSYENVIYPILNPTTPPITTNPPIKCINDCGGSDHGDCTPNGCVCKSSWIGVDCLSTVVFTDQPIINVTSPTTQTELPSGDTVTYSSLVSVHSIREITPNGTIVYNNTFSQWILTDISSNGSTKYLYNTNFTKDSITTNITVTLEWFNSTKMIEFAGQNLTMNPSTMKYNVNITKYSFELGTNTLQVIFAASLQSSATEDTCSKKDFGDVPLSDLEYVKLKVNQNSLYGRFIKRGIIDQRVRSISNTLLDESGKPTESYQSQSMIAINVPHFFNNAMLDPDFSILVDSGDSDDTDDDSVNCTFSKINQGLSRNQIIGIAVGGAVFVLFSGFLGYYLLTTKFRYSKLGIILLKSRIKPNN
ncbi:hypothetical protein DLAC_09082 [Tieghemostelium lacteum]|uniref:EGF-like domain-containing protein n=1 Tax=Tieghemostelium lacteum TaxID=361077 RepID=A0A151Z931_TIELA|nr:hypothetical protein DLAC_09082 [Tieghemostelium lacteum]|eukprot:KYQ90459.1 hypothetical protein DLAC_09082 [Tieghemostelium lacteum]